MIYNHFCHTSCGDIQGIAAKAPGITAFKDIQYAKAGRWEYPRQITHWDGIYDASQFGPNAMQESAFIPEYKTGRPTFYYREFREGLNYKYSEDCLYLRNL